MIGGRIKSARRRHAFDHGSIWAIVRFARMELDDNMRARDRPVEQAGQAEWIVEATIRRSPSPGDHDHPVTGRDPELGPDGLAVDWLGRHEIEPRRATDAHLILAVHAC